jgi:hypothetical protein
MKTCISFGGSSSLAKRTFPPIQLNLFGSIYPSARKSMLLLSCYAARSTHRSSLKESLTISRLLLANKRGSTTSTFISEALLSRSSPGQAGTQAQARLGGPST